MASVETALTAPLTVQLTKPLLEKLSTYLKDNPDESVESILEDALYIRTFPGDPGKILELAGAVPEIMRSASEQAEDSVD